MTSWLRDSPLRVSLGRRRAPPPLQDVDPAAAFHSFIKHWQQTCDIIERTRLRGQVFADDVTAVINHLTHMVTLLLVDLKQITTHKLNGKVRKRPSKDYHHHPLEEHPRGEQHSSLPADVPPNTPIFDHFLGEEILDKIVDWSLRSGEFVNALKLEQLRVHEQLLSHSRQEVLVYKPIIRPLLKLLASCSGCVHSDVEKRLVVLLNQLCVSLMHNQHLLDFFFQFSEDQGPTKFVIFSLLLPYVHREGGVGQQARDALLLCMALSASHKAVGQYIAQHSNFCPVLAAGLSGLYSMLPRSLNVESDGWHRLTPEDITDIPQLQLFLNSLEFCNAVVQVAHPLVRQQLVEFLYQGFLVPVLGPALHQGEAVSGGAMTPSSPVLLSVMEEVVAATAYVELCLRTVTEPELLRVFLAFLLTCPNGPSPSLEPPIITLLISRLHSPNTQLCLVTLSLFWTLVELNCEDLMVALVFQYLTPCTHVMLSQRSRLTQPPKPATHASHKLLHLIPAVCQDESFQVEAIESPAPHPRPSPPALSSLPHSQPSPVPLATPPHPQPSPSPLGVSHHRGSLSNLSTWSLESEAGSLDHPSAYSDYLQEAQARLATTTAACGTWTWRYDGLLPSPTQALELLEAARVSPPALYPKPRAHSDPVPIDNLPGAAKVRSSSLPGSCRASKGEGRPVVNGTCEGEGGVPQPAHGGEEENLDSLGESSGYESFNIRASRDASPANSTDGSPRTRLLMHPQGKDALGKLPSPEEDHEFLESLQRSSTPTEQTGLEETLCEIDQAFSAFKIYDASSPKAHNKVYCLELVGEDGGEWDSLPWQSHESSPSEVHEKSLQPAADLQTRPTIGPFLEALMLRVDQMLTSSIHVNLLVATLLSRLASYPTPLLSSLLLDASIVFQPAVRSLVQVLSGLKQRIDSILEGEEARPLVVEARTWFMLRVVVPRHTTPTARSRTPSVSSTSTDTPLMRGEGKRRSLSQTVTSFFRRPNHIERPPVRENPLQHLPDKTGYRYTKQMSVASMESSVGSGPVAEKRHAARCAILLRDWLLELSALAQEQMVAAPTLEFKFPSR